MPTEQEIVAGARAINRELGCHGGPTVAECVYMVVDGDCDCARVAAIILAEAEAVRAGAGITIPPGATE